MFLLSLPKPCSYENTLYSRMKYNDSKPVTGSDPESTFTTWMTCIIK